MPTLNLPKIGKILNKDFGYSIDVEEIGYNEICREDGTIDNRLVQYAKWSFPNVKKADFIAALKLSFKA